MNKPIPTFATVLLLLPVLAIAEDAPKLNEGKGEGWRALGEADFVDVNGDEETWTFDGELIRCTGRPIGVIRTAKKYTNLELVVWWKHEKPAGNSGVFLWATDEVLKDLPKGKLPPGGIEVQVLDPAYETNYEKRTGKKPDWFTGHGDVFPVGSSKMTPFPPMAPNKQRSFPTKRLVKPAGEWNHYYVRAVDGEVRLSVNGEEVSGGKNCMPASGYLCLESEGAPVEFKGLRIRELP